MLHEIAEVIGADPAVRLGQAMGGARVYVPNEFASNSLVVMILGEEAVQKLCYHFAGDTLEIPSKRQFDNAIHSIEQRLLKLEQDA